MTLPRSILEGLKARYNLLVPSEIRGAEFLWKHLCALAEGQFDEKAIREHCALYGLNEIAGTSVGRHQHALNMAALLKEREELAQAKAEIERLNNELGKALGYV